MLARSVTSWLQNPPVPPPLNLLSLPYHTFTAIQQLAAQPTACLPDGNGCNGCNGRGETRRRFGTTAYSTAEEVALPSSWLAENSVGGLSRQLTAYLISNDSQTVREEKWRTELIAKVKERAHSVQPTRC